MQVVKHFCVLPQDGNEVCRLEHQTPGYTFLHDFALTPTHYVLVQNPVKLELAPFLLGKVSAAASVKWIDNKAAEVHLLKRPIVEADAASQQRQPQQQHQSAAHSSNGGSDEQDGHGACVSPSGNGVTNGSNTSADATVDKDGASGRPIKQHSQQAASRLFHQPGHQVCEVNALQCFSAPVQSCCSSAVTALMSSFYPCCSITSAPHCKAYACCVSFQKQF